MNFIDDNLTIATEATDVKVEEKPLLFAIFPVGDEVSVKISQTNEFVTTTITGSGSFNNKTFYEVASLEGTFEIESISPLASQFSVDDPVKYFVNKVWKDGAIVSVQSETTEDGITRFYYEIAECGNVLKVDYVLDRVEKVLPRKALYEKNDLVSINWGDDVYYNAVIFESEGIDKDTKEFIYSVYYPAEKPDSDEKEEDLFQETVKESFIMKREKANREFPDNEALVDDMVSVVGEMASLSMSMKEKESSDEESGCEERSADESADSGDEEFIDSQDDECSFVDSDESYSDESHRESHRESHEKHLTMFIIEGDLDDTICKNQQIRTHVFGGYTLGKKTTPASICRHLKAFHESTSNANLSNYELDYWSRCLLRMYCVKPRQYSELDTFDDEMVANLANAHWFVEGVLLKQPYQILTGPAKSSHKAKKTSDETKAKLKESVLFVKECFDNFFRDYFHYLTHSEVYSGKHFIA